MNTKATVRRGGVLGAVAIAACGLTLGALSSPTAAAQELPGFAPAVQKSAIDAVTSARRLSVDAAKELLRSQPQDIRSLTDLAKQLGDRAAGTYLDEHGTPVVNVLDQTAADSVRKTGAVAKLVTRSATQLTSAHAVLDRSVTHTAIGIDNKTNQVVLTIADAADKTAVSSLLATAGQLGDAVRVQNVPGAMSLTILGGEAIRGDGVRCSAGFSGDRGGARYNVTAGHCTKAVANWDIGPSEDAQFPGADMGLIRVTSGDAPSAVHLYGQGTQEISDAKDGTVGQEVCKSGSTTNLTCGEVTEVGVTVNYPEGSVRDLTKTNAQVNSGDSGGCLFDGSSAIGITSGMDNGGNSYFQPAAAALSNYGVTLG
ncbi:streptogrisin D [Herbihabitans rhizosphaerae]|uniref:Streptogrisin D n=1 Tax=Herbihabitans rhizosphaerae TaxID=1872711 RepID=A0A4Q7KXE6_9PSEU|nr:S1 family peptidase [Herbihabitans rhizosphaerae]RZS41405.1 streptogrisin D [Herbihabitans rhizosphaerae]